MVLALVGCGTPPAKDFGGSWKPVNRFQDKPTEIPLALTYTFYASPMDGTLKTMLTRWSKDTGMTLSYQLTSDFTLYQPVSKIQTNDVRAAVAELSTIYAAEGVLVTINDKQILVSVANISKPDASESKSAVKPPTSASTAVPVTSSKAETPKVSATSPAPVTPSTAAATPAPPTSVIGAAPPPSAKPEATAGSEP